MPNDNLLPLLVTNIAPALKMLTNKFQKNAYCN